METGPSVGILQKKIIALCLRSRVQVWKKVQMYYDNFWTRRCNERKPIHENFAFIRKSYVVIREVSRYIAKVLCYISRKLICFIRES